MSNPYPRCSKCNTQFHYQVPRPWFVKNVLFFLDIRKYFCPRCVTTRYSRPAKNHNQAVITNQRVVREEQRSQENENMLSES